MLDEVKLKFNQLAIINVFEFKFSILDEDVFVLAVNCIVHEIAKSIVNLDTIQTGEDRSSSLDSN